jgi:metallo-beta-lactamase class B
MVDGGGTLPFGSETLDDTNPASRLDMTVAREYGLAMDRRSILVAIITASAACAHPAPPANPSWDLHGAASAGIAPFTVVGNIYYVGARNIASYLVVTPAGDILIDTGTREMEPVLRANLAALGIPLHDIKILLSGHAHFDHVQGHAAMQRATGAKVMALGADAAALEAGKDLSPLGAEGWDPVHVDRVLGDRDTVELGGTTLTANWAPGHTPGCTVWSLVTRDDDRDYTVVFFACAGPNADVTLVGNPKFPTLVDDTRAGLDRLEALHPDIVLTMHPEDLFAGKLERLRAHAAPNALADPSAWHVMLQEVRADLDNRVAAERARVRR